MAPALREVASLFDVAVEDGVAAEIRGEAVTARTYSSLSFLLPSRTKDNEVDDNGDRWKFPKR